MTNLPEQAVSPLTGVPVTFCEARDGKLVEKPITPDMNGLEVMRHFELLMRCGSQDVGCLSQAKIAGEMDDSRPPMYWIVPSDSDKPDITATLNGQTGWELGVETNGVTTKGTIYFDGWGRVTTVDFPGSGRQVWTVCALGSRRQRLVGADIPERRPDGVILLAPGLSAFHPADQKPCGAVIMCFAYGGNDEA